METAAAHKKRDSTRKDCEKIEGSRGAHQKNKETGGYHGIAAIIGMKVFCKFFLLGPLTKWSILLQGLETKIWYQYINKKKLLENTWYPIA